MVRTVLFRQVDCELVNNFTSVTGQRAEQRSVTVHNNEAKLGIRLQQLRQCLSMKFVVAKVK